VVRTPSVETRAMLFPWVHQRALSGPLAMPNWHWIVVVVTPTDCADKMAGKERRKRVAARP
jgi:hypothetical protein